MVGSAVEGVIELFARWPTTAWDDATVRLT